MKKAILATLSTILLVSCNNNQNFSQNISQTSQTIDINKSSILKYQGDHSWSYDGENGPNHWGDLNDDFIACKSGKKQSPINLVSSSARKDNLKRVVVRSKYTDLSILNNGHTIQLNPLLDNYITLNNKSYKLLQFHFHAKSEHSLNGEKFPMEAHLVHQDKNGNLAVLGVFIKEGAENNTLKSFWNKLPKNKSPKRSINKKLNVYKLLPSDKTYLNYSGSLTTPGCNEGVNWVVFPKPITASKQQISDFTSIFDNNARPLQPLNSRVIKSL